MPSSAAANALRRAEHHRRDGRQHEQRHERVARAQSGRRARRRPYRSPPARWSRPPPRTRARARRARSRRRARRPPTPSTTSSRNSSTAIAAALPRKIAPPSRPGEPQAVARAVRLLDRERAADREQRGEQHRGPEQAGRGRGQRRAVGVEREREHHDDDPAERQDLLERDARPALDAQVLARDEQRLAQEASRAAPRAIGRGTRRGGAAPGRRAPGRPTMRTSRGRELAGELELVRREQHRAALGRRGAHDLVEHARGPARRARRAARRAAAAAGRARARSRARPGGADPARAGRARRRATRCEPEPLERGVGIGRACARRRASRSARSRGRSGRRNRTSRGRRARATGGSRGGRPRGRRRAPRPCPDRSGSSPAHSRSSVVLPAPFAPDEQHDLARLDVEIGACERGESPEHANGRPKVHDTQKSCSGNGERVPRECTKGAGQAAKRRPRCAGTPTPQVRSAVVRRTIAAIGRTLVTLGLLILLFVAYQLWGTGIFTARAQTDLKHEFSKQLQQVHDDNPTSPSDHRPPSPATPKPADDHDARSTRSCSSRRPRATRSARSRSRRSASTGSFVEGVQLDDLAKGPGHYPGTPLPGQIGNAAIAGHRTTHGAPFFRLNELDAGRPDHHHRRSRARSPTSCTSSRSRCSPTDYCVVDQHARRAAHAHELQPALLGRRAHRHQGEARAQARARSRTSRRR